MHLNHIQVLLLPPPPSPASISPFQLQILFSKRNNALSLTVLLMCGCVWGHTQGRGAGIGSGPVAPFSQKPFAVSSPSARGGASGAIRAKDVNKQDIVHSSPSF